MPCSRFPTVVCVYEPYGAVGFGVPYTTKKNASQPTALMIGKIANATICRIFRSWKHRQTPAAIASPSTPNVKISLAAIAPTAERQGC